MEEIISLEVSILFFYSSSLKSNQNSNSYSKTNSKPKLNPNLNLNFNLNSNEKCADELYSSLSFCSS